MDSHVWLGCGDGTWLYTTKANAVKEIIEFIKGNYRLLEFFEGDVVEVVVERIEMVGGVEDKVGRFRFMVDKENGLSVIEKIDRHVGKLFLEHVGGGNGGRVMIGFKEVEK